jgi:hypothetical protein
MLGDKSYIVSHLTSPPLIRLRALTDEISQYILEKEELLVQLQEENVRNARYWYPQYILILINFYLLERSFDNN